MPSPSPSPSGPSFSAKLQALLRQRELQRPLEQGLVRCPLHPGHHIPLAGIVSHLKDLHMGEDLSSAEDAMYSANTSARQSAHLREELYGGLFIDGQNLGQDEDQQKERKKEKNNSQKKKKRERKCKESIEPFEFFSPIDRCSLFKTIEPYGRHRRRHVSADSDEEEGSDSRCISSPCSCCCSSSSSSSSSSSFTHVSPHVSHDRENVESRKRTRSERVMEPVYEEKEMQKIRALPCLDEEKRWFPGGGCSTTYDSYWMSRSASPSLKSVPQPGFSAVEEGEKERGGGSSVCSSFWDGVGGIHPLQYSPSEKQFGVISPLRHFLPDASLPFGNFLPLPPPPSLTTSSLPSSFGAIDSGVNACLPACLLPPPPYPTTSSSSTSRVACSSCESTRAVSSPEVSVENRNRCIVRGEGERRREGYGRFAHPVLPPPLPFSTSMQGRNLSKDSDPYSFLHVHPFSPPFPPPPQDSVDLSQRHFIPAHTSLLSSLQSRSIILQLKKEYFSLPLDCLSPSSSFSSTRATAGPAFSPLPPSLSLLSTRSVSSSSRVSAASPLQVCSNNSSTATTTMSTTSTTSVVVAPGTASNHGESEAEEKGSLCTTLHNAQEEIEGKEAKEVRISPPPSTLCGELSLPCLNLEIHELLMSLLASLQPVLDIQWHSSAQYSDSVPKDMPSGDVKVLKRSNANHLRESASSPLHFPAHPHTPPPRIFAEEKNSSMDLKEQEDSILMVKTANNHVDDKLQPQELLRKSPVEKEEEERVVGGVGNSFLAHSSAYHHYHDHRLSSPSFGNTPLIISASSALEDVMLLGSRIVWLYKDEGSRREALHRLISPAGRHFLQYYFKFVK